MTQELEKAREALKVATVVNNGEAVSGNVIANNSEQAQDDSEWQDQKYHILLMKKR